jgi:hypothetical protein
MDRAATGERGIAEGARRDHPTGGLFHLILVEGREIEARAMALVRVSAGFRAFLAI